MPQPSKAQNGPKRVKSSRSGPTRAPELLFMDEVAQELRVSLNTVKRLIKTKELASMKIAGQRRISRFDLNRYFRAMRRAEHAQASSQDEGGNPSPLTQSAQEIAAAASALFLMCEGGQLVVSKPSGRYAQVPIVATAQGMPLMPADVARIFQRALEQLGHIAPGGQAPPTDPRQRPLDFEPDVELDEDLDEDPPLLESDAEDMLREEEEESDLTPEERAERREGDPQYDSRLAPHEGPEDPDDTREGAWVADAAEGPPFDPYPERL